MNKSQANKRIQKLRELINEYRYEYHVNDNSIMSESAADSLKHELSELESQYPELITPDSPTQRVAGGVLPQFTSAKHSSRMLSLNDVFNKEEVTLWKERIEKLVSKSVSEYFIDIKMDGFACALIYENGTFSKAITRGDGFTGEDVTANVKTLESVPLELRFSETTIKLKNKRIEVRGEIIMTKDDFEEINAARKKQDLPLYANPRNLAAGTIRQLDPKLVAARPLQFRAYDLIVEDTTLTKSNEQTYNLISSLGFIRNKMSKIVKSVDEIMNFAKKWEEKRHDLKFGTDGLVVKVNDRQLFKELGVVGKAPRGAIAFKFPAEQATTKIKDIFVSIGRTGAATPVAILEPVPVAGTTVQMATLHNAGEVKRKDIRIGDTVIIHKAGDIIPEVIESLAKLRTGKEQKFAMPKSCPECGTKLVKENEEAVWRCPNNRCPARMQNQIGHFASKGAMDIDGLGEKNVVALMESGLINDVADLYSLHPEQLIKLERFAEISAHKLVDSIQKTKNPTLNKFLFALGMRHVGSQTARDLAENFHTLDNLRRATIDELRDVEGIGEVVAESIVAWFAEEDHQQLLNKLMQHGVNPQREEEHSGPFKGMSFVVTGTLEYMSREKAAEEIIARGGSFQAAVSKETTYLVTGEKVGASKLKKAEGFGTKIINEQEFLKLLEK